MMDTINQAIAYIKQYPELIAVIGGMLASWGLVGSLEAVIPPSMAPWRQKLITLIAGFAVAVAVSVLIWKGVAPADRASLNYGVSITAGLIAPTVYVWVTRLLTHFFPWLTAWAAPAAGGNPP